VLVVWAVLVVVAVGVLAMLGRSVWRKAAALRAAVVSLPTLLPATPDPARRTPR
jgi:type IV secretory pathway VirB2 component (pilin)